MSEMEVSVFLSHGGVEMGLGINTKVRATSEMSTNRQWNYKSPETNDIPIDFRCSF